MTTIQQLAQELCQTLAPACHRIEIAGSIRRGKTDPRDIELVAIAKTEQKQLIDMFGAVISTTERDLLADAVYDLVESGQGWQFDTVVKRNGPKYKRLRHTATDFACDLFITEVECWGVIFTIRTGPADFSKELVTRALRRGLKVDSGLLWRVHRDGGTTMQPTPEENDLFNALRLPYIEPGERTIATLMRIDAELAHAR